MNQDASNEMKRNLVWNPPTGSEGGNEFKGVQPNDNVYVSSMQVWTHNVAGGHEVLKAIELTWSDGDQQTYGNPRGEGKTTTFQKSERIRKMRIYSGDWVDSIYYESTRVPSWRAGGGGGKRHDQDTGNGVFAGLWGRSGSDIDKLGSVFEAPDRNN